MDERRSLYPFNPDGCRTTVCVLLCLHLYTAANAESKYISIVDIHSHLCVVVDIYKPHIGKCIQSYGLWCDYITSNYNNWIGY